MSYYFIKSENRPITEDQLNDMINSGAIKPHNEVPFMEQGIYNFDNMYKPQMYLDNIDLFTISAQDENGVDQYEYFEETKEIEIPDFGGIPFPMIGGPNQQTTVTIKGYRFKWRLVAYPLDTVKPLLLERLSVKKHAMEDAGVKLPDGTVIQSAEADRNRIAQLMISLVYLKVFNPSDTEFKQYMDDIKFKVVEGVYRPITEAEILYFFKVMAIRTLACFERENVISTGICTATDGQTAVDYYFEQKDLNWPA